MKITFLNRSDLRGGAAVVTLRLMQTLRDRGVDARMVVCEKLSDNPHVALAAPSWRTKIPFLKERLGIYLANGRNRADLFKVDTASSGLPLWKHPWVKQADVVVLNWINQGMLSLKGIERIAAMGKPIAWTMHDMWCMTGICHHAGQCRNYKENCGNCPFLGTKAAADDLSSTTWKRKNALYRHTHISFVAVSNWLAERARHSRLMHHADIRVIHNVFPFADEIVLNDTFRGIGLVFGAARLDDPVKGLPILTAALRILAESNPALASKITLETFGDIRNPQLLENLPIHHNHLGVLRGENAIRQVFERNHIVVSTSLYETLPGTLVEGQAYGCIPVSFDRGGQSDITNHLHTGYIAPLTDEIVGSDVFLVPEDKIALAAHEIAKGIEWAADNISEKICADMHNSVKLKFGIDTIASKYLDLFHELLHRPRK